MNTAIDPSVDGEVIYCIGDSHASFFSGLDTIQPQWPGRSVDVIPFFRSFRVGAALAWSLLSTNSKSGGREKVLTILDQGGDESERIVPANSYVLLCFGEIDCRCHVVKQAKERGQSFESIIEPLVGRYTKFVDEVAALGFRPLVWNAIASTPKRSGRGKEFPIFGTPQERNEATSIFNSSLKTWCDSSDAVFVDIYEHLVDSNGRTRNDLLMDQHHLSQEAMPFVLDWLRENLPGIVPDGFELPSSDPADLGSRRFDQSHQVSIAARYRSIARRAAALLRLR